jgi:hypothetical protein
MTVHEAIQEVRKVGTIRQENGKLKLRFPETERARLEAAIETLRRNRETALQAISIPPAAHWPESLSELATEVGERSGDPEGARRQVWLDWDEWKAQALNRLCQEQGVTGQPGRITAATVRHGEQARRARLERERAHLK